MFDNDTAHRTAKGRSARAGLFAMLAAMLAADPAGATRIKDIVSVENVRDNQLIGYGLVVGLQGTGDRLRNSPFTEQSLKAMLERMGVNIRDYDLKTQNVAAVSIVANLPPFARRGSRIDVTVAALGDATSLQGGTLIATPLSGLDGEIYAVAQGPVAVSGFSARGAAASINRGSTTGARIASGAIVEREVPFELHGMQEAKLALTNPDFATARAVRDAINRDVGAGTAIALDPATVSVRVPAGSSIVDLMASIETLEVRVDQPARVVINEASGTVVMGSAVRVSPVAIAHGALTIAVSEAPVVSQPAPLARAGETVVVPRTQIGIDDGPKGSMATIGGGTTLRSLVDGLNRLGVAPRDLITILQSLKAAGALQAEIEVN